MPTASGGVWIGGPPRLDRIEPGLGRRRQGRRVGPFDSAQQKPVACLLGAPFQFGHEGGPRKTRRDRIEHLDLDQPRMAQKLAPRPVEPGHVGNGHHRHVQLLVNMGNAALVGRLGARRPARAFRIDDDLAPVIDGLLRAGIDRPDRLFAIAAIDGDHLHARNVPTEQRDPHQLPFENVDRVRPPGQEGDRVPGRLVLRGDDVASLGQFLAPAHNVIGAGDDLHQPQMGPRPEADDPPCKAARAEKIERRPEDHLDDIVRVEGQVEQKGPDDEHGANLAEPMAARRAIALLTRMTARRKGFAPVPPDIWRIRRAAPGSGPSMPPDRPSPASC